MGREWTPVLQLAELWTIQNLFDTWRWWDRLKVLHPMNSRLLLISVFKADPPTHVHSHAHTRTHTGTHTPSKVCNTFVCLALQSFLKEQFLLIFALKYVSQANGGYLNVPITSRFCFAISSKQFNQELQIAACFISPLQVTAPSLRMRQYHSKHLSLSYLK